MENKYNTGIVFEAVTICKQITIRDQFKVRALHIGRNYVRARLHCASYSDDAFETELLDKVKSTC